VPCSSELTEGEFVMVFVVQDIYEGGQEGVKILIPTSSDQDTKYYQEICERTSSIGNSVKMAPSFSSKLS
jgi:hypothetical protein